MTYALATLCVLSLLYATRCRVQRDVARAQREDALRRLEAERVWNKSAKAA